MELLQLLLPTIVILAGIAWKLNHNQKRWFFKCPVLISSTALSFGIAHFAGGVMGFYAALLCDIVLFPGLLVLKKLWRRKEEKLATDEPRPRLLMPRMSYRPVAVAA